MSVKTTEIILKINGEDVFSQLHENQRNIGDSFCFNYQGEQENCHVYHIPFNDVLIQTNQEVFLE